MTKKCSNCKFATMEDYGYSDYTVEGTTVDCSLNKNPDLPTDNFYGEAKELKFAEECQSYLEGGPFYHLNVDIDSKEREELEKELEKFLLTQDQK